MHRKSWMAALALGAAGAFATTNLTAQDAHQGHDHGQHEGHDHGQAGGLEMPAELSPGPMHEHLNAFVGEWKAATKFWMEPGAPPTEGEGRSEAHWIMDGRWLMEEFEGEFQGQVFNGMALTGYDPYKKKYINTWCDSMSTMMMISEGTCDEAGKVFTYTSKNYDPWMQMETTTKTIIRVVNHDRHDMEMYMIMPGGEQVKTMEIVYTRVK